MVPLKFKTNFWRTLEIPLINCEINFIPTRSNNYVTTSLSAVNQVANFAITATKLYVPLVTHENTKLFQQLKPAFQDTIIWNKYQSKSTIKAKNQFLDYLIDQSSQEINRLFVLSFENDATK